LATQKPVDAAAAFREAIQREPKWWVPYRNLSIAQSMNQDTDGAIATLRAGIDRSSTPDPLQAELAARYEHLGKIDQAIEVYEAALRANPNSDVDANNLAMLIVNHRTDARSLDRARDLSARFSESPNPNFLDTYGWVLYKRGEAAAAVAALQSAAAKSDDAPIALYHLGMAQVLAGEPDAAKASLTRSVSSGKNFFGIDDAKAELDKLAKEAPSGASSPKS
jgi:tetratricopeptide (TPR) repeat protein